MARDPELRPIPEGVVTFLFSDLEGSTRLLEAYGAATGVAMERHHVIFEELIERNHGTIFETVGDAVYAAFASPANAVAAALDAHRALAADSWTEIGGRLACRIAIHSGEVERRGTHYFGAPLFRCARLQSLAYGEQTVVSAATASLVGSDLPPRARLIDHGIHWLKDLQEPEHVFELQHPDLRADFPPLKSLDARQHNLPLQLSSFVGRDAELEAVSQLLDDHRLVTLLGPGGIGKTRLALQVAADRIDEYANGAWFVDLSAVRDPQLIVDQVAQVLNLREEPDVPILESLSAHLRDRQLLLVLDNLEQLLPAGARIVADLMAGAPKLSVLTTSRSPLRIRGELEHEVPPLSAGRPDRTDAELPGAVALFLERAREIRPDLAVDETSGPLIADICNRLDGLPLAIELAAARLRLFSLQALHDRLAQRLPVLIGGASDLPQRQQALRGAIAWSDELLTEEARTIFHRLGAFAGSFTLEAAIAAGGGSGTDVEAGITTLLEHSLLRRQDHGHESRYVMLETIREYAHEQLVGSAELETTMERMADHVCELAGELHRYVMGSRQSEGISKLELEMPNVRAILEWSRDKKEAERLARLVADLMRFWVRRGLSREGRGWITSAVELLGDEPTPLRAALYSAEGTLLTDVSPARAAKALQAAATINEMAGDRVELARNLVGVSNALLNGGQNDAGREAATRARALAAESGDHRTEAAAIGNLAMVSFMAGQLDEAETGFREAVRLFQRIGDAHAVVIGLGNLGELALGRGDVEAAVAQHRLGLEAAREFGDPGLLGWELMNLAQALGLSGEWLDGLRLLPDAIASMRGAEDDRSVLQGIAIAARLLWAGGDLTSAAEAWTAGSALSTSLGIPVEVESEGVEEALRQGLGEAYDAAERSTASLSLDAAVELTIGHMRALVTATEESPTAGSPLASPPA